MHATYNALMTYKWGWLHLEGASFLWIIYQSTFRRVLWKACSASLYRAGFFCRLDGSASLIVSFNRARAFTRTFARADRRMAACLDTWPKKGRTWSVVVAERAIVISSRHYPLSPRLSTGAKLVKYWWTPRRRSVLPPVVTLCRSLW